MSETSESICNKPYDAEFHKFVNDLVRNKTTNTIIFVITILFGILLGLETTDFARVEPAKTTFRVLNEVFVGIYTLECVVKVYCQPFKYFFNPWNIFDILLLGFCYATLSCYVLQLEETLGSDYQTMHFVRYIRAIRSFRIFKILRTVSHAKGLQVIVNALLSTIVNSVLNVMLLILLIMFIFSIIGNLFFSAVESWRDLSNSMWTLFRYICVDEWPSIQKDIDNYIGSRIFTTLFVFIGNFIFANIFIGLMIMNISDAQDEYRREKLREKAVLINSKKEYIIRRQTKELNKLIKKYNLNDATLDRFNDIIARHKQSLKHEEVVYTNDLSTNLTWLKSFFKTLNRTENTIVTLQNLHFEQAIVLASIIESRLACEETHLEEENPTTDDRKQPHKRS